MTPPHRIRLEARLAAIEYLVIRLYAAQLAQAPDGTVDQMIENYRTGLAALTIPDLHPVQSDLAAQETTEQVDRVLQGVKELLQQGRA